MPRVQSEFIDSIRETRRDWQANGVQGTDARRAMLRNQMSENKGNGTGQNGGSEDGI